MQFERKKKLKQYGFCIIVVDSDSGSPSTTMKYIPVEEVTVGCFPSETHMLHGLFYVLIKTDNLIYRFYFNTSIYLNIR